MTVLFWTTIAFICGSLPLSIWHGRFAWTQRTQRDDLRRAPTYHFSTNRNHH